MLLKSTKQAQLGINNRLSKMDMIYIIIYPYLGMEYRAV